MPARGPEVGSGGKVVCLLFWCLVSRGPFLLQDALASLCLGLFSWLPWKSLDPLQMVLHPPLRPGLIEL